MFYFIFGIKQLDAFNFYQLFYVSDQIIVQPPSCFLLFHTQCAESVYSQLCTQQKLRPVKKTVEIQGGRQAGKNVESLKPLDKDGRHHIQLSPALCPTDSVQTDCGSMATVCWLSRKTITLFFPHSCHSNW